MTPTLDVEGPAAPPRDNGELAFEHPWQGRMFATTMALCEGGRVDYAAFRDRLIDEIGRRSTDDYWPSWQDALEATLEAKGLCDPAELGARSAAFAAPHEMPRRTGNRSG